MKACSSLRNTSSSPEHLLLQMLRPDLCFISVLIKKTVVVCIVFFKTWNDTRVDCTVFYELQDPMK